MTSLFEMLIVCIISIQTNSVFAKIISDKDCSFFLFCTGDVSKNKFVFCLLMYPQFIVGEPNHGMIGKEVVFHKTHVMVDWLSTLSIFYQV